MKLADNILLQLPYKMNVYLFKTKVFNILVPK